MIRHSKTGQELQHISKLTLLFKRLPVSLRKNLSDIDVKIPGPGKYEPEAIKFRPRSPNWKYIEFNKFLELGQENGRIQNLNPLKFLVSDITI